MARDRPAVELQLVGEGTGLLLAAKVLAGFSVSAGIEINVGLRVGVMAGDVMLVGIAIDLPGALEGFLVVHQGGQMFSVHGVTAAAFPGCRSPLRSGKPFGAQCHTVRPCPARPMGPAPKLLLAWPGSVQAPWPGFPHRGSAADLTDCQPSTGIRPSDDAHHRHQWRLRQNRLPHR